MKPAAIARCWTFVSSRGDRRYQSLQYADGTTSCDCPGWCRRVAADGSRSCKHTRAILLGCADRECESAHDYRQTANVSAARSARTPNGIAGSFGQLGRRRISVAR